MPNSFSVVENGSVTSPRGFAAAGVSAGIKQDGKLDCALLVSHPAAKAAAAFTENKIVAAPVVHGHRLIAGGQPVRALFVNSGNANACTGAAGGRDVEATVAAVAEQLQIPREQVFISSTGRIGEALPMEKIHSGVKSAASGLSDEGGGKAAEAIMTTDTRPKSLAVQLDIDGVVVTIGGMAKGAGMIAPRLKNAALEATMLAYITTDVETDRGFLDHCLRQSLDLSFNRITVDGDTSTNDTSLVLANGNAGNRMLTSEHPQAREFINAFNWLVASLAREIVLDGEGVTRFVELRVSGAANRREAKICAEAIANSVLCKTAWFGGDPNWGRIIAAAGYSGATLDPEKISLDYQGVAIVRNGEDAGTALDEQQKAVSGRELVIELDLGAGTAEFTVWTCDLSYEYVRINADYRT